MGGVEVYSGNSHLLPHHTCYILGGRLKRLQTADLYHIKPLIISKCRDLAAI